jgi:saccharopine dehydrogenase-like NADP-dependent oxidoreductase
VENGKVVTRPALSESEFVEIEGIGTLEAFNTDGLRTLIGTMKIPFMKEKTLRYPGHVDAIRVLRDSGFLDCGPVAVPGGSIRPVDLTARLLFPRWKLGEEELEFTVMKITLRGEEKGRAKEIRYFLLDRYDPVRKISSMARTTGYACTAAAELVLAGKFVRKGIIPPEWMGADSSCFEQIMKHLEERGVIYKMEQGTLDK